MDRLIDSAVDWRTLMEEISPSEIVILTDENTALHCLPAFEDRYLGEVDYHHISVDPGETSKSLETAEAIYYTLMDVGIDRRSLMINLGGGVVTDLGGFVASTFKRGISFVNVPTTHLGMVDAALGGKNGVNFEGAKNQIGTVKRPTAVVFDPSFLDTLPERELISGWMETVKHALIADEGMWKRVEGQDALTASKDNVLLRQSAEIKMRFADEDPDDLGKRQALNFGHTIGHAIEAESDLLHGEAVAIGTIAELYLSHLELGLEETSMKAAIAYIKGLGMPLVQTKLNFDDLLERMKHDKKNEGNAIRFALISHLGRAEVGIGIAPDRIKESLDFAQRQVTT